MHALARSGSALLAGVLPVLLWACGGDQPAPATPSGQTTAQTESEALPPAPMAGKLLGLSDEEQALLDRSVSPCDDFFQFACGGWIKATPIPDDEASWMRSFSGIRKRNEETLKQILEDYAAGKGASEAYAKPLGEFYASCMDEAGIEKAGVKPLAGDLKAIDALKDKNSIVKLAAAYHARGIGALFDIGSQQDFTDSTKVIGVIDQAGIGMPDRDYYLKADGKFPELRGKYEAHVAEMLRLLGSKNAAAEAKDVLAIETALAKAHTSKEDRRDPKKIYHLVPVAELNKLTPNFPWQTYLAGLPVPFTGSVNVTSTDYLKAVDQMLGDSSVTANQWRAYFRWQLVHHMAPMLPQAFVQENFQWQKTLAGVPSLPPRWKRCVRRVDNALGEALAQPFVKQTLGSEGKEKTLALVHAIEAQMHKNLESTRWMDAKTKEQAFGKLKAIANQIAYPDKFRSYDGLKVEKGNFYANVVRAEQFELKRTLNKIGKPVDKTEWYMTPPTVNAYYDPSMNQMVFPAGILQPPFYANAAHPATNFGGIGMVMGHELTHGFDDEGRQFDATGNLRDWWSAETNTEFERRASCVEKQFDGYSVLGENVNGKLTLGENIADLGGVKLAYAAMAEFMRGQGPQEGGADAVTPEQRFFLGYAQSWCGAYRDEMMRVLVATNPHSPPQFRVNGPLSNLPEFAKAFSCTPGHKMARKDACEVW